MTAVNWHAEYLIKCAGFSDPPWDKKFDKMLTEWKTAADKIGLTEDDVKYAVTKWLPQNFDLSMEGVRKLIGCYTVEAIDLTKAAERKANGEKIVYGILPAHTSFYRAFKFTDPKVNTYFVDMDYLGFMQTFFHKIAPVLEYAEEHGIRLGCRHCALNKTKYAILSTGIVPMPDVNWTWGFICDQAPKTEELLQESWDSRYTMVNSRFPHHGHAHENEYQNEDMVKYLGAVMRDGYEQVCKILNIKVDEKAIWQALEERMDYLRKFEELYDFMAIDPPTLNGEIHLLLAHALYSVFNTGFEYFNDAVEAIIREVKDRVAKGKGIVPKGSPKGMMWFVPLCNPFIMRLFEENGCAIAYCDSLLPSKADLELPKFTDPFEANAEAFLKEAMITNWGRKADLTIEKMERYNIDFMIWGFEDYDRWLASDQKMCLAYVQKKTGKPCFYIEGDSWEDRDYSEEALRTRIETVCEIVKAHKS